jgi:hypothetical protein
MSNSPLALRIAGDIVARINSGDLSAGVAAGDRSASQAISGLALAGARGAERAGRRWRHREPAQSRLLCPLRYRCDGLGQAGSGSRRAEDADPYFSFAEDWLNDRIEGEVTEQAVRDRYGLTRSQAQELFVRAAREGWAEPKPGYGWRLRPVAKTSEAFEQIYRFRAIIEPAAIMEPTFRFDKASCGRASPTQERWPRGSSRASRRRR